MQVESRLRARDAFDDCLAAYRELKEAANQDVFRRRWLAFITLLRAVGNVLHNIDSKRSEKHRDAIESRWKTRAKIHRDFIERNRSLTIKEYQSSLVLNVPSERNPIGAETSAMAFDGHTGMAMIEKSLPHLRPPLQFVLKDGEYVGRSVYDVCEEALTYLDEYLADIETAVS